jgi:hypothetical protein
MSVFAKHLTEMPQAPHVVVPSVPAGLGEIVMRSLKKDPAERFQRIEDLQAAVVAELAELGTSGIETLLDSGALRRLAKPSQPHEEKDALATRDELESYERKLRRTRLGLSALIAVIPLAGLGAGGSLPPQPRARGVPGGRGRAERRRRAGQRRPLRDPCPSHARQAPLRQRGGSRFLPDHRP